MILRNFRLYLFLSRSTFAFAFLFRRDSCSRILCYDRVVKTRLRISYMHARLNLWYNSTCSDKMRLLPFDILILFTRRVSIIYHDVLNVIISSTSQSLIYLYTVRKLQLLLSISFLRVKRKNYIRVSWLARITVLFTRYTVINATIFSGASIL